MTIQEFAQKTSVFPPDSILYFTTAQELNEVNSGLSKSRRLWVGYSLRSDESSAWIDINYQGWCNQKESQWITASKCKNKFKFAVKNIKSSNSKHKMRSDWEIKCSNIDDDLPLETFFDISDILHADINGKDACIVLIRYIGERRWGEE